MTLLELQAAADHADRLRTAAEESRRSAESLAASGHRIQASSQRFEALLHDLQATALEARFGPGRRPVPARAVSDGARPPAPPNWASALTR